MVRLKIQAGCAFQNFLPAAAEVVLGGPQPHFLEALLCLFKNARALWAGQQIDRYTNVD